MTGAPRDRKLTGEDGSVKVYPGPIGAILNPLLKGVGVDDPVDSLPYASTPLRRLLRGCPVRIDIPTVLVDLTGRSSTELDHVEGSTHPGSCT